MPCGKACFLEGHLDDWQWINILAADPGTGSATCYVTFHPGPPLAREMVQYQVKRKENTMAVIDGGGSVAGALNVSAKFSFCRTGNEQHNPDNVGAIRMFTGKRSGIIDRNQSSSLQRSLKTSDLGAGCRHAFVQRYVQRHDSKHVSSLWAYTFATMTASQPGVGTVNFGTVQGTANSHGAFMRTFQYFPYRDVPLSIEFTFGQFTANLTANEEWRVGLGLPSAAGTAPTDGVFSGLLLLDWLDRLSTTT